MRTTAEPPLPLPDQLVGFYDPWQPSSVLDPQRSASLSASVPCSDSIPAVNQPSPPGPFAESPTRPPPRLALPMQSDPCRSVCQPRAFLANWASQRTKPKCTCPQTPTHPYEDSYLSWQVPVLLRKVDFVSFHRFQFLPVVFEFDFARHRFQLAEA